MMVLIKTERIANNTLEREEITVAVRRLKMGWTGGPSGMRAENLKVWIREATRVNNTDIRRWKNW